MLHSSIRFFIKNRLFTIALLLFFLLWGWVSTPFNFKNAFFSDQKVSVDAVPDIGENQQIVYTVWEGQSPQDIENQITYPLTSSLLGIKGVRTVRGNSMFGYSSIYLVFDDNIDFYWARNKILEKLSSLPSSLLPNGVRPKLGPDATSLGQIFWYTLEGRDENGEVTGGWDLHEIRSIQDFYVKNALQSVSGVSEVASIGGYVKEYQVDIDPERMRHYKLSLNDIVEAVKECNIDVGAKTLEINKVEYFVRGIGYVNNIEDIENSPIKSGNSIPIRIKDVAKVVIGPAERRGILDKEGAEVVGGAIVSRYGENPMETIAGVKQKIAELSQSMPSKILDNGQKSKLTIIPFYDRSELINKTLGTLKNAISFEVLITLFVIILMLRNLRVSLLVGSLMPMTVLAVFAVMKWFDIEANIVALSGIAIAIGTVVDMGIILSENIVRHLELNSEYSKIDQIVGEATQEVSGAILTAALTTIISFVPVFMLTGAEGKMFMPLAFTKTAALAVALLLTLFVVPAVASKILVRIEFKKSLTLVTSIFVGVLGSIAWYNGHVLGVLLLVYPIIGFFDKKQSHTGVNNKILFRLWSLASLLIILAYYWRPLGYGYHFIYNLTFVLATCGLLFFLITLFSRYYESILIWALNHKLMFLSLPLIILLLGIAILLNTGREFMPTLDEGSYLLMPSSMPHSGVEQNQKVLKYLDMAVASLPEIETVIGKAGRMESALDPAPLSMFENMVFYKPEYILDQHGRPMTFRTNKDGLFATKNGDFVASGEGYSKSELIEESTGNYYRNWRPHIENTDDIWKEILSVTDLPGVTSSPKLQPIETRLVMLQTGMRANMGIKVKGHDINDISDFGTRLEEVLKKVEGVDQNAVFAERVVGKPYLLLEVDRDKIARHGITMAAILETIEIALGGKVFSQTIEGRERYNIRVRYPRELRGSPEEMMNIYVQAENRSNIPISELVNIKYEQGAQSIKSEDGFLTSYVIFDREADFSESEVVTKSKEAIESKIRSGELRVPEGVTYSFSGSYENLVHAEKKLSWIIPLVLVSIFLILYIQFRSVGTSLMIFTGVGVSLAGGFILIWLYGQSWFMNFSWLSLDFRQLFNIETINLSVAVWVGFIALFGIASDDGVVMATYLKQSFEANRPNDLNSVHASIIEACKKRIRPCLMTTATTLLALLPIMTSKGLGSDIMVPMAIPCFGGILVALVSLFIVPVLYGLRKQYELNRSLLKKAI